MNLELASDRGLMLRLLRLGRPHLWRILLAGICLLVSSVTMLAVPYMIRMLTDSAFVHHDGRALNRIALTLAVIVLATAVFRYGRSYLLASAGNRVVADLRVRLYAHLQEQPVAFYDSRRTGELMSRVTNDTTLVQAVVTSSLLSLVQNVFTLIAIGVIVILLDWRLALVTLALAPVMAATTMFVGRRTRRLTRLAQEALGEAGAVLEETLSAIRIVKAFGRERHEMARYGAAIDGSLGAQLSAARLGAMLDAVATTAGFGAVTAMLWFGGREVLAGHLTPGGLLSFLFYLIMLIGPLQGLASLWSEFQSALGAATRIFELLDTVPTVVDRPDAYPLSVTAGRVELQDVRFAYGDGPEVLHGVSLTAEPGQTVALVGPSGAGKTTLVSLLPRFYVPTAGRILVDGHDIAHVTTASLRAAIALVPQEATLFGGTVRENIAYGRIDATAADVEHAARMANAHDFIMALPQGYDSIIGERGVKLSGGQRQRVAIARALLKDAPILILDEATSSLDNESESLVQGALQHLMAGRTTFVIAHRLTTVERAHTIVVLDGGRVVEVGSHRDLLAREGLYYRLYMRDFRAERQAVSSL